MSDFTKFRDLVRNQIAKMQAEGNLFRTDVDVDLFYASYLGAFPDGTNPLFRERTEHDCSCCRQFIRTAGNMVTITKNGVVTPWDIKIDNHYQQVADTLAALLRASTIKTIWLHDQPTVGVDHNHEIRDDVVHTWTHFQTNLDHAFYDRGENIASRCGAAVNNYNVLKRSLTELTLESIDIVLDLIAQKSLYRGEEHLRTLRTLKGTIIAYNKAPNKENFLWLKSVELGMASGFRNTVIGTLLVDLSEGRDLEASVNSFEAKVAPQNYKRPTALVTKAMIQKAKEKVSELGLQDSLQRRYAVLEDITINNVLFADRSVKQQLEAGVFDILESKVSGKLPDLTKIAEVTIDKFISDILPKADSVEVLFENQQANNMVSLIAPVNPTAPNILKWNNNFSWSYIGSVTDSIKERVKAAGGNIEADVRCSLSWFNSDDLDLSVQEPDGNVVYYGNRGSKSSCGGQLDVDMHVRSCNIVPNPVENITYDNASQMKAGTYTVIVHNYNKRASDNPGFIIEVEIAGQIYQIEHPKALSDGQRVQAFQFTYNKTTGFKVITKANAQQTAKEHWGIMTNDFHKVQAVMYSPNHWDDQEVGNKHIFFMLQDCVNPESTRGLYNEFLAPVLNEHRKVFEMLGDTLKTPTSASQLSGLGFSTTKQAHVICRVSGTFNRVIKVVF